MREVIKLIYKKLKNNKFAFINISNNHKEHELIDMSHDFIKIAKEVGFNHWDTIIWVKRNSMPPGQYAGTYLSNGWEYLLAFTKGKDFRIIDENYYSTDINLACKKCGEINQLSFNNHPNYFITNVGCFGREKKSIKSHDAPFPIEVPMFCFKIATTPNDIVLDPFAGSGTSLIAGLELGLNVIGCELISDYCSDIIEELTSLK